MLSSKLTFFLNLLAFACFVTLVIWQHLELDEYGLTFMDIPGWW